jgi:Zn-dependent protease with chaperone function
MGGLMTGLMTGPLLGALGLVLSLLVPNLLARARWPARAPQAAVVLWQCVTLASVLSAVGVVLAVPEQVSRAIGTGQPTAVWVLLGTLAVAALIVLRLLLSLFEVMRHARARRARHRMLADLLDRAEQHGDLDLVVPSGLRVLDGPVPFAYCLPGRSPRVVLSGGTLQVLAPEQVAAVLAHEQAHLSARHDLVMEAFTALYRALPRALRSRTSLDAVHLLLEMLADDAARRRFGAQSLRAALTTMGGAADALVASTQEEADGRDAENERRRRLARLAPEIPAPHENARKGSGLVPQAIRSALLPLAVYGLALSVLVLPTVVLVVPWLTEALGDWPLR